MTGDGYDVGVEGVDAVVFGEGDQCVGQGEGGVDVVAARGGHQVAEGVVETVAPQRDEDPLRRCRACGLRIGAGRGGHTQRCSRVSPPRVLGPVAAGRECSMTCPVGNRLLMFQKNLLHQDYISWFTNLRRSGVVIAGHSIRASGKRPGTQHIGLGGAMLPLCGGVLRTPSRHRGGRGSAPMREYVSLYIGFYGLQRFSSVEVGR